MVEFVLTTSIAIKALEYGSGLDTVG